MFEITISNTDQYTTGTIRNHFATGGGHVPSVRRGPAAVAFPQRFGRGAEADQPFFRYATGEPVPREVIHHLLELAATVAGEYSTSMPPHSLRIGAAAARYHAAGDLEVVKRSGRWSSGALHGYLWEAHDKHKGLAPAMAKDRMALAKPAHPKVARTPPAWMASRR